MRIVPAKNLIWRAVLDLLQIELSEAFVIMIILKKANISQRVKKVTEIVHSVRFEFVSQEKSFASSHLYAEESPIKMTEL